MNNIDYITYNIYCNDREILSRRMSTTIMKSTKKLYKLEIDDKIN